MRGSSPVSASSNWSTAEEGHGLQEQLDEVCVCGGGGSVCHGVIGSK